MGRPLGPKSVRVGTKVRLEDSFQDQLPCPLHHAVADTRNLKRSDFAVALRDLHPAIRHGLIPACEEVFPHCQSQLKNPHFAAVEISSPVAVVFPHFVSLLPFISSAMAGLGAAVVFASSPALRFSLRR